MDKARVGTILAEIAVLLALKGENPFKANAYANAARRLEGLTEDLGALVREDRLGELPGFGPSLVAKVTELVRTGRLRYYEDLKAEIPQGVLDLLRIPGLGPKRARLLREALGISSLGELEYACHENRLLRLKGFGETLQRKVLEGIAFAKRQQDLHLFPKAWAEAERLRAWLARLPGVTRAEVAGSLRRRKEVVKDIDLLVACRAPAAVMTAFRRMPGVASVIGSGETKTSLRTEAGIQVDLRAVSEAEFPAALLYFTGSQAHSIAIRSLAKGKGLLLNEYGLFRGKRRLPCPSEADLYKALGMATIPPELREDLGEIRAATEGKLPVPLEEKDLKGVFHVHTTESDGADSLEDMVLAAQRRGYAFVGISDHSRAAGYAHGLDAARVRAQHKAIDALQRKVRIRIFKGTESDILPDGSLDYDAKTLASFDFVIASVHGGFDQPEKAMTARICKALSNPRTTMLGHATGRLLLSRPPYAVDMEKVIDHAAKVGVAIEINANPQRLDLDWRLCRRAVEKGVRLAINPDAHQAGAYAHTTYGIGIARKGWVEKDDILNTMTVKDLEKALGART